MEMASALRKRWRVVLVSILVVLGLGAAYVNLVTPSYSSTAQLFVNATTSQDPSTAASDSYIEGLAVQQRMSSYVQIATSYQVLSPVVTKLHLPYTWQHLKSNVSASNPTTTDLLNISASDSNSAQAARLANAVASRMVEYIRTIDATSNGRSAITATINQPAFAPSSPSSPRTVLYLIAAGLIGAAIGIALAFVRDALDNSVKSTDDLSDGFRTAVLGAVPLDRDAIKHPIAIAAGRGPRRAEAYRQIRTNLQFAQIDEQPRSILVTSAIAGEGKTSVACNLAVVLAQLGVDVILLEGDLRRPKVAEFMGVERAVGLTSVLVGWVRWTEALQNWGSEDVKLRIMASGPLPPNPSEMLAGEQMGRLMAELENQCDVVVIDGPPLLPVADSAVLANSASGTILVVREGKTKRTQLTRALSALAAVDAHIYGLVLNMARKGLGGGGYYAQDYSKGDALQFDAARDRAARSSVNGVDADIETVPSRSRRRRRKGEDDSALESSERSSV